MNGLRSMPKSTSPKYLYDKKGSELFESITKLSDRTVYLK
ncbi:L-histidine N(alpha)-methyltransferase [Fictibacillus phosphorivorans]